MLQNGDDLLFAALSTVHVVCATVDEVAELTDVDAACDESAAILLEQRDGGLTATPAPGVLAPEPDYWAIVSGGDDERFDPDAADRALLDWVQPVADAVSDLIDGDDARLAVRAARARSTLSAGERDAVDCALRGVAEPSTVLLLRAAAVFRADDLADRLAAGRWVASLAGIARNRLVDKPLPGARWATHDGCGHEIDGVEVDAMVECGMGFVPKAGRRFLWLFTDTQ